MSDIDLYLLEHAYQTLDCDFGSSYEHAMGQYKWLAYNFHTDRTQNPAFTAQNESKMKDLNAAKQVLEAHFRGPGAPHKTNGCVCQSQAESAPRARPADKEDVESAVDEEEKLAKQRTKDRARKRGRQTQSEEPEAEPTEEVPVEEPTVQAVKEPEPDLWLLGKQSEEMIRWKVAGVCFAVMGATYFISYVGQSFHH